MVCGPKFMVHLVLKVPGPKVYMNRTSLGHLEPQGNVAAFQYITVGSRCGDLGPSSRITLEP